MASIPTVRFTAAAKESMAYPVRHGLEDKTMKVPALASVDSDFRKIRKEETSSGNVRFTGERDSNGHADRFWAAALCREAKGNGTAWTFDPVVVAPDAGASGAIGTYDNFTSRKLD